MAEKDLSFGFDTKFFEAGMNRIQKSFSGLQGLAGKVATGVTSGFQKMAAKTLVLVGGLKGVTKLFDQIPEIGKTFGIAKDIIFRNFLFPLRKAIFPMLQKFLDWTRDNRKTFVVWGAALADVFSMVSDGIGDVLKIGKELGRFFVGFINRTFGLQLNNFTELINLTVFKMAVAIEFLKAAFPDIMGKVKPFIDLFADGVGNAIVGVTSLVSGFLQGVSGIEKPLQSILETINSIGAAFTTIDESGNKTNRIFETIGKTLGTIFKFVGEIVDAFLTGMKPAIIGMEGPFNRIAKVFDSIFGDTETVSQWKTIFEGIGKIVGGTILFAFQAIASAVELIGGAMKLLLKFFADPKVAFILGKIGDFITLIPNALLGGLNTAADLVSGRPTGPQQNDAMITKDGKVTPLSPEDNIFAFKKLSGQTGGGAQIGTINLDFSGMTIQLPAATPEEAEAVGFSIVDTIRTQLNKELVGIGAV